MPTVRRMCGAGAAVLGGAAAVGLVLVAAGTPGMRLRGSVSMLGAVGSPMAGPYRVSVLAISASVGLLAVALAPGSRAAALSLAATAALGTVSAAVRCTPGCPLPPDAAATAADVAHVVTSSAAFALLALAMLLLARRAAPPLARICWYGVVLVTALGTPVGVAILVTGEGLFNGILERAMMAVALAWLISVSTLVAGRGQDDASSACHQSTETGAACNRSPKDSGCGPR